MSTTPVTPAPVAIHPSFWAKAATWFVKESKTVKNSILWAVGKSDVIAAEVQKIAPTLEEISNLVLPNSGNIEAHVLDVWATVASAVDAAGEAATANGLSVSFDAAFVAAIKAVAADVKKYLPVNAGPAPAPAVKSKTS